MIDDRFDAPTADPVLTAARSVRDVVLANATSNEQAGRIEGPVLEALWSSGLMRIVNPVDAGGLEPAVPHQLAMWEELAWADASVGWIALANFTSAGFCAAYLPDDGFDEVFGGPDHRSTVGGQFFPNGVGESIDDGFTIVGQYQFGSGTLHASHVAAGFIPHDAGVPRMGDDGLPEMRVAVIPREQVAFADNWDVTGLRATGSVDYSVQGVVVPEHRTFPLFTRTPRRGGWVWRHGVMPITGAGHAGWALGVARAALDDVAELGRKKIRMGEGETLIAKPTVQRGIAHHLAMWRAAHALLVDEYGSVGDSVRSGADLTPQQRADLRMAVTFATECAREIVQWAHLVSGTTAIRSGSRLERGFHDLYTGTQHAFISERIYIDAAQITLGLVPDHPAI